MKTHAHFGGQLMCNTRPKIGGYPCNVPLETFWRLPTASRCKLCVKRLTTMNPSSRGGSRE